MESPARRAVARTPRTVAVTTVGSGLLGAAVGWLLMRGAYVFDRSLAEDQSSFWSFNWSNASFGLELVTTVVAVMAVTFTAIAVAVSNEYHRGPDHPGPEPRRKPAPPSPTSALDILRAPHPDPEEQTS